MRYDFEHMGDLSSLFMHLSCMIILNARGKQGKDASKTLDVIRRTLLYMENDIYGPNPTHGLSEEILGECINKHKLCAFWAVIGGKHGCHPMAQP